jgi:hypothetical protein
MAGLSVTNCVILEEQVGGSRGGEWVSEASAKTPLIGSGGKVGVDLPLGCGLFSATLAADALVAASVVGGSRGGEWVSEASAKTLKSLGIPVDQPKTDAATKALRPAISKVIRPL